MQYDKSEYCIYVAAKTVGFQTAFATASNANQHQKKDPYLQLHRG